MPGSARLRDCQVLRGITRKQVEVKRLYASVCAPPAVTLSPWGLLKRKQTTCHPAFMDKFPTFWLSSQIYKFRESRQLVEALALVLSFLCHWWNGYLLLNVADDKPRKEEFNEVSWSFDHPPRVLILVANGFSIQRDKTISAAAGSGHDPIILPGGTLGAERLQRSRILKCY
ncbi:protein deglycase [Salvia divinorum]|uniref:Protein deglycase n=1 Tax=Salvia divinorum TaxID=28513 RepID=A0ABD1HR16_SALDI